MSEHKHQPATVRDRRGTLCPRATPASYPLVAVCQCGRLLRCADGTADWALAPMSTDWSTVTTL